MKEEIHPKFYRSTVTCSCGNVFETGGTKPAVRIEVCSKCHPFYTGEQRVVDSGTSVGSVTSVTSVTSVASVTSVTSVTSVSMLVVFVVVVVVAGAKMRNSILLAAVVVTEFCPSAPQTPLRSVAEV